jgi:sterol desaturase/sphingolipid hydroxylase (fatty acid hydroxylase superfamily)
MLKILFSIISYDVWFYISHVLLHTRTGYPIHKEHHTKPEPKFLDTYVGHSLEGPFQGVGMLFPLIFVTMTPMEILAALVFLNLRGMARHDSRAVWLIGNHHLLHHKYPQYNFGEYWIDSLCGTRYPNAQEYQCGLIYI